MTQRQLFTLVILGAIMMGFISGKLLLFNGSAMNVFPWGILALGASFLAISKRQAIKFSTAFSFIVSFSFLLFNNTGTTNLVQALKLIAAASIASSFGLLCGVFLGWLGWKVRHGFKKERRSRQL
jgi:hypothetical protein